MEAILVTLVPQGILDKYHDFQMKRLEREAVKRSIYTPLPSPGVVGNPEKGIPYPITPDKNIRQVFMADGSQGRMRVQTRLTQESFNKVAELHRAGTNQSEIARQIFGEKGGNQLKHIRPAISAINEQDNLMPQ